MLTNDYPEIKHYLVALQDKLCRLVQEYDPTAILTHEPWEKPSMSGDTRVFSKGYLFEKGGINFSHVRGDCLPATASARHPSLAGAPFQALGISVVLHPTNPFVPTTHANIRFFAAMPPKLPAVWWFGGGYDLTPYYPFEADCQHWHQTAATACAPFGSDVYQEFKQWCDEYFYLKHRQETRGIGGIFFDDLNRWPLDRSFEFMRAVGDSFSQAYFPIVAKRMSHPYGDRERAFQAHRRSRYVEFNLVYDRGTLFGLQSNGRIESILMSMPPIAAWHYNWQPEPNSKEAELTRKFLQPRQWVSAVAVE